MPNTRSAKKRMRQNAKRRLAHRATKSALRTEVRKFLRAVSEGDVAAARAELPIVFKKLDKAGARRVIHPNAASRTKARLALRLAHLERSQSNPSAQPPVEG